MRPHQLQRARARGFTLIELMVVVIIIAILAVIAVPLFARRIQEMAVNRSVTAMSDVIRGARTRALGRGAAVMVRVSNTGLIEVFEGVQGTTVATATGSTTCANLPTRGCTTNTWVVGAGAVIGTARTIGGMAASTNYTTAVTHGGVATTPLSICFSPSGRTFVNPTNNYVPAGWQPLTNVVNLAVTSPAGRTRNIIVPQNGIARVGL